ncbi:MAG: dephospho-CoA kinase [Kiritimatiellales bacterium]
MNSSHSIILGITGGIACGKTEAGHILSAEGFKVLDSDFLAHELMAKNRPVYRDVVAFFGQGILAADGEIDRRKLGVRVFGCPQELAQLNRLVHPAVMSEAFGWISDCREQEEDAAVLVPLLFETGWTDGWDAVVCIAASEEIVFQRLEKRGLSKTEAGQRIAAQWPVEEKAARSDFIIQNDDTLEAFREQMIALMNSIRAGEQRNSV